MKFCNLYTGCKHTNKKYPQIRKNFTQPTYIRILSSIQKENLVDKMGTTLGLGFCTSTTTNTKTFKYIYYYYDFNYYCECQC